MAGNFFSSNLISTGKNALIADSYGRIQLSA
jgi:hypothetical protein